MAQVADYSAGFPGAQALRDAKFVGAVRYIGFPDRRKCTTSEEVQEFKSLGLGMALVVEDDVGDWRRGHGGGKYLASLGLKHAERVQFPAGHPLYMAVDSEVTGAANLALMGEYLQGAAEALGGPAFTGVYGSANVVDYARDHGLAEWFWQTSAWSYGRHTPAHLYQRLGHAVVNGVQCDINDALVPDWGQAFDGSASMLADDDIDAIAERVLYKLKWSFWAGEWRDKDGRNPMDVAAETLSRAVRAQESAEASQASAAKAVELLGTLLARPTVTIDAPSLAAELQRQGVQGATPAQIRALFENFVHWVIERLDVPPTG